MSGGALNYLCFSEPNELIYKIDDIEKVEAELLKHGCVDIAKDVRRLIEYVVSANNRISVLQENLGEVFRAVEWYQSGDIGNESLLRAFDKYRNKEG